MHELPCGLRCLQSSAVWQRLGEWQRTRARTVAPLIRNCLCVLAVTASSLRSPSPFPTVREVVAANWGNMRQLPH